MSFQKTDFDGTTANSAANIHVGNPVPPVKPNDSLKTPIFSRGTSFLVLFWGCPSPGASGGQRQTGIQIYDFEVDVGKV